MPDKEWIIFFLFTHTAQLEKLLFLTNAFASGTSLASHSPLPRFSSSSFSYSSTLLPFPSLSSTFLYRTSSPLSYFYLFCYTSSFYLFLFIFSFTSSYFFTSFFSIFLHFLLCLLLLLFSIFSSSSSSLLLILFFFLLFFCLSSFSYLFIFLFSIFPSSSFINRFAIY